MKRTYTYKPAAGLGKWVAAAVWLFVLLKISVVAVGVLMLIAVYQPMQTALANQRSLAGLNIPITDTRAQPDELCRNRGVSRFHDFYRLLDTPRSCQCPIISHPKFT